MSIEEQMQIVEDNLNEYGQCNITLEEFTFLKQQIRADAIDEMKALIYQFDNYCNERECKYCWMNVSDDYSCLKQWINSKFEELKEQK